MSIRQRIIAYLDFKGISKYKFYKDLQLSNGFLDKTGAIGTDKCEIIINQYPDINLYWLITGEGSMLKDSEQLINNGDNSQVNFVQKIKEIEDINKQQNERIIELLDRIAEQKETINSQKDLIHLLKKHPNKANCDIDSKSR